MKDKRLNILLEHFTQERECRHYIRDQGMGYCHKMMKDEFPKQVNCAGSIKACELEE